MNSRNTQRTDILKFRADTGMPRADGHEPRHECITQRIRGLNHYGYVVHPPYIMHNTINNSYLPVIGVHEMHGRMHPNYWPADNYFVGS